MFQQLLSRIQHDENPRLHHTPFLILWVASYGLGWFLISIYRFVVPFQESDFIFIGLLFGISLAVTQTWLLKQRYGYAPRFWTLATIVGAIISKFNWYWNLDISVINIILLSIFHSYIVINIFQTLILLPISQKAWRIIGVGIMASLLAYASHFIPIPNSYLDNLSGGLGRIIQAIGTGLVMLQIMSETSSQITSKDTIQKVKENFIPQFQALPFLIFWIVAYDMVYDMVEFIDGIVRVSNRHFGIFNGLYDINLDWLISALIYAVSGFVLGFCQQWLMKQYDKPIRHWIIFTTIGWFVSHVLYLQLLTLGFFRFFDPYLSYMIILFVLPILFQSLTMLRTMRLGWTWILTGFITVLIVIAFVPQDLIWNLNAQVIVGKNIIALITGITFLLLCSFKEVQPKQKIIES